MSEREVKAGTSMYFGAPAKPMPKDWSDAITRLVAMVEGIREAHLPQCYIQGESEAAQVLAISVDSKSDIPRIAQRLMEGLREILPTGVHLDILPFHVESFPNSIRGFDCQIFAAPKKPWWKIWS